MILLARDAFREAVFARDNHKCVICWDAAKDAHHIMERRLFDNGGYFIDNGASLCEFHHIQAEKTLLTPEVIREAAKIQKRVLPDHLYPDYEYDKWGNIVNANDTRIKGELFFDESVQKILASADLLKLFSPYVKYPRTFHLPFSPGKTDDDKTLPDCSIFENKEVVITMKMDGENTTGYWDGYIHARSLDGRNHESRNWVKNFLAQRLFELPEGWRICGENLYAKHAIHYKDLPSYFLLFSIWNEKNECLSWADTIEWAKLLNLKWVESLYWNQFDEEAIKRMYPPIFDREGAVNEGFVIRNADSFPYAAFRKNVAKFVRAQHIQENKHWIKTKVIPNELGVDK